MNGGSQLATPGSTELTCANCGRQLDPTDKFCRDCGLPTIRRAEIHQPAHAMPPDTGELKRALSAASEPQPFLRTEAPAESAQGHIEATEDVVRATNPTHAARLASATLLMVLMILLLALAGIVFLVLALRP